MHLPQWAGNGWLRPHHTTKQRIADLLAIVNRDLDDSTRDLSEHWQFATCDLHQSVHVFPTFARREKEASMQR
jgi:hypothetical protein